ncbi:hypothetical protein FSP39_022745 [Pinctada imbricata]|uniref:ABC transporter domain-containing protein n=1 Tax=Pinctada imbricata TaxID=66713 RepID=A0AA88YSF3_PINIB|nr:hypothetical protein FSP39_022745 [Pinctada imbricata]
MPRLGGASQFGLLFWKELVLLKQKKCVTVFQISLPIAFAALLIVIRLVVNNSDRSDTTWNSFVPKTDHNGQLLRTKVLYTPDGQALNDTMVMVANKLGSNYSVMPFSSEALLNEYRLQNLDSVWAAVIFDSSGTYTTSLPDNVQYTLRVARKSGDDDWNTDDTYPFFQQPGYRDASAVGGEPYYYTTGFLGLQMVIDNAIINKQEGGTTYDGYTILMQKMAYIAHVSDGLIVVVQNWLPLFILLAFMITALQTTKSITYEKERRLKEAMKLMGMNTFVYWLIIFLKAFIFSLIAIFFFVILLKVDTGTNGRVLSQSNAGILLLFLILYSISLISYCIMMSTFFSKANVASNAAAVLYILMYVPWFFLTSRYEDMTRGQKLASCLLFNTAMAMGFNVVGLYEGAGSGAQFTNFYESATVDDNFALIHVMVMLLVDSAIMLLIAWYVGTVFPGDFGVPQPFYFPFTKTYWCGAEDPKDFDPALRPKTSPEFFEREPEGLKAGIEVRNLRKVFGRGEKKKIAVAGTNVTMYKGQITALLGHNGAGKTTTMSMLTGFLPPTSGSARVGGHDIVQNIEGVRRSLGMCPQHDILFDTMSVENHLQFYARMKGVDSKDLKKEVDEMINTLGLQTKRDALSMTLSGGQKRKLSVGIALIGGSEIVILDEPTSGMDPGARRQTWDILQKFRNDRCMVLSTHFMDEADVLGDRIAIMAEGVVKCCGTSLFLKKAFGAGYHLVMVKSTSGCNVDTVTQLIQSHIPSAIKESEISMELSYLLPFDQSSKFKSLFEEVETRSQSLGIASFGVSATTMEEVFLKVGESGAEEALEAKENLSPVHRPTSASGHGGKGEINGFVNNAFENGPPEKMEMKPITNGAPKDEGEESTSAFIGEWCSY